MWVCLGICLPRSQLASIISHSTGGRQMLGVSTQAKRERVSSPSVFLWPLLRPYFLSLEGTMHAPGGGQRNTTTLFRQDLVFISTSSSWFSKDMCTCMRGLHCVCLCDPMGCSPPSSSLHGVFQASIPEWVTISFSRGSSWHRDRTRVSCIGRWVLYH